MHPGYNSGHRNRRSHIRLAMHHRCPKLHPAAPAVLALAAAVLGAAGVLRAETGYLDARVFNDSREPRHILAYDNVCQHVIFDKRILAEAELPVNLCAGDGHRGDVTLRNRLTGAERRYSRIIRGSRLKAP
jgi:hypothetical protein